MLTILFLQYFLFCFLPFLLDRSRELRTQKLRSPSAENAELKVLALKSGEGQYIAIYATLTARDFFLDNFYPSGPFICICPKSLKSFSCVAVASTGSCVGPQNRTGPPTHRYRQMMQVPVLRPRGIYIGSKTCVVFAGFAFRNCGYDLSCGLRKRDLWYNDLWNE